MGQILTGCDSPFCCSRCQYIEGCAETLTITMDNWTDGFGICTPYNAIYVFQYNDPGGGLPLISYFCNGGNWFNFFFDMGSTYNFSVVVGLVALNGACGCSNCYGDVSDPEVGNRCNAAGVAGAGTAGPCFDTCRDSFPFFYPDSVFPCDLAGYDYQATIVNQPPAQGYRWQVMTTIGNTNNCDLTQLNIFRSDPIFPTINGSSPHLHYDIRGTFTLDKENNCGDCCWGPLPQVCNNTWTFLGCDPNTPLGFDCDAGCGAPDSISLTVSETDGTIPGGLCP